MKEILASLINILILFLFIRIWMIIAKYIGDQLGVSKLIHFILSKIRSSK